MRHILLSCGLFLLLANGGAQTRTFTYDAWFTHIYTDREITGYVWLKPDPERPGVYDSCPIVVMDEQLHTMAELHTPAKSDFCDVKGAARYGHTVGLLYKSDNKGIYMTFVSGDSSHPVRTYRINEPRANAAPYREVQQVVNIPGVGFAVYYGRRADYKVQLYDSTGIEKDAFTFPYKPEMMEMLADGHHLYFLTEELVAHYDLSKKVFLAAERLTDKEVLNFKLDPVTGRPYLTGCVLHPGRKNQRVSAGRFTGIFTMDLDTAGYHTCYTMWRPDSVVPVLPKQGVRDLNGHTIFAGRQAEGKRTFVDPFIWEVDDSGRIVHQTSFPTRHYDAIALNPGTRDGHQWFYPLISNGKVYLEVTDLENTYFYSVAARKVILTVPYKEQYFSPAANGYVMKKKPWIKGQDTEYVIQPVDNLLYPKD
jgi:hypothetical protein